MLGNFFGSTNSASNCEPLNLSVGASKMAADHPNAELWSQLLLASSQQTQAQPGQQFFANNILQQLQAQQQQQQLAAFLTLKNHLEQLKSHLGASQRQPEPPIDVEDIDVAEEPKQTTPKPAAKSSRKRARKLSSEVAATTAAATSDGASDQATPPKSVCIGGYYDANNVFAKLVTVSDEARRKLAAMPNIIGDYVCALCSVKYEDAFCLAAHNCPKLEKTEHRCPECNKVFSCPANLASHRRWHRPKDEQQLSVTSPRSDRSGDNKAPKSAAKRQNGTPAKSTVAKAARPSPSSSSTDAIPRELVACPLCNVQLASRDEVQAHIITSHLTSQLATGSFQSSSKFANSLMAAVN